VASGVLFFVIYIIGLGLGPPTVGWLSDYVFAARGPAAVQYSLVTVGIAMGAWGLVHFLLGARHLPAELRALEQRSTLRES
jgi:hypothetical protein